ncbi:MAG: hypothetical protein AAGF87_01500 [Bacteroidota bacterium]
MSKIFNLIAISASLLILACGGETSAGGTDTSDPTTATAENTLTEIDATRADAPIPTNQDLPESCGILDEDIVRSVFSLDEEQALIPVHGQLYGSCYYRFATEDWAADLVLETINEDQKNIFQQQFSASSERASLAGKNARWENEGRILLVDGEEPFIVKLSILPRGEYGKAVNESDRRAYIVAVAELVNEKM